MLGSDEVKAVQAGYVSAIQAESIGIAAMLLGAGRETKDSIIDLAVGIRLSKKIGDAVQLGETLAVLHVNMDDATKLQEIENKVLESYQISEKEVPVPPLIYAIVTRDGVQRF
ncbi:hypothetical protein ACP8HI_12180 [Paenibacillus sp. FA6]|uniref:hypothetical protein n=1 Tax=Paenibacillus sp. FA6 TaxID=3413029 RepID=UPI003F655163